MIEHGGNTNDCGCPIGNCDCDPVRLEVADAREVDRRVLAAIKAGHCRHEAIWKAVGSLSISDRYSIDKSLQHLRREGKIAYDGKPKRWRIRESLPMTTETKAQVDSGEGCHSGRDGDCSWKKCPQLRDNEPEQGNRHCPLDRHLKDEE